MTGTKMAVDLEIDYICRVPPLQPMPLAIARAAFRHADWIFELKWDGFRSPAYIDGGRFRPQSCFFVAE